MSYAAVIGGVFGALTAAGFTASVRIRRWDLYNDGISQDEADGSPWAVNIAWESAKPGSSLTADVLAKPEDRILYVPAQGAPFAPRIGDRVEFPLIANPSDDTDYLSYPVVAVGPVPVGSEVVLYEVRVGGSNE